MAKKERTPTRRNHHAVGASQRKAGPMSSKHRTKEDNQDEIDEQLVDWEDEAWQQSQEDNDETCND